jgi:hypothetical protein
MTVPLRGGLGADATRSAMKKTLVSFLIVLAFVLAAALLPLLLNRGAAIEAALWKTVPGESATGR